MCSYVNATSHQIGPLSIRAGLFLVQAVLHMFAPLIISIQATFICFCYVHQAPGAAEMCSNVHASSHQIGSLSIRAGLIPVQAVLHMFAPLIILIRATFICFCYVYQVPGAAEMCSNVHVSSHQTGTLSIKAELVLVQEVLHMFALLITSRDTSIYCCYVY